MRAVNLLPREPKRQRQKLSVAAQLAIVAPLVVAAVIGALYLVSSSRVNDRRAELRALQDEIAALPTPEGGPQQPTDPALAADHDRRVAALADALRARIAWDRILRQISSVLPEDVWLQNLSAKSPGAVTTVGTAAGAPLKVHGYTYSQEGVARFLARLAVIPELDDVRLKKSELTNVAGRLVVKFDIEAGLRPQGQPA